MASSPVRVVSTRTVKPPPRPRERIPLTSWDVAMLSANYIQKGLLFAPPHSSSSALLSTTAHVVEHLAAALAATLRAYYPVAGRFVTEKRPGGGGCSVSIDCDGQGVEIVHAVAGGVSVADVVPPDADVPCGLVHSFFPLRDAVNYDGHHLPLFVVQVTELDDGVFVGFAYNHALSDGTAFWDMVNAWAEIARARLTTAAAPQPTSRPPPLLKRWSPEEDDDATVVLPYADVSELIERLDTPPLRERMVHFSPESLAALKERARQELLDAGDTAGAAAITKFQALTSLLWRCITRARCSSPDQETVCRVAINNRGRLRPPLPREYFGNSVYAIGTEASPVRASELVQERGHGWAAAAVGRAVAAHTDAGIRARVAAWGARPTVYTARCFDASGVMVGSSPRFDMYGCDFGWGKAVAARSGKANKSDGKASLYPARDGGGGVDAEVVLAPEHMAALELDGEFWAAVTPDHVLRACSSTKA
ncbi:protein ENHANCED PSEUDOMONAS SUSCEPTIBILITY 1-like [Oryza glaberrima]|uniref:Acetyltransferase n=1 Tax=Oryza glaberrima TaxID=4538 RepID=I1QYW9_ORYGL|nr:protein ENHANCED PSEUDOMONAS SUSCEPTIBILITY 1-like [Oryza glaberrima]